MYADSKDLAKKTVSDKILKNTAYEIALNQQYDGYQRGLVSMVFTFFDKKTRLDVNVIEMLSQELHKPVLKTSKKRKVYDNIWAADFIKMGLLSSKS